ncbi:MAG: hypothetical protein DRP90_07455 [Planctomycetota bacterium]|nr:MAG: hypothetical protein DRP90_07455 [Planctomycetota bacterium]
MVHKRLGRGFDSLVNNTANQSVRSRRLSLTIEIPLDRIRPNPYQPRRSFDEESVRELADSIKQDGVLSPVMVRREGDHYVLVAGERRLRAAKMAGLERIPAIVRDVDDREMLELSIIENIQREDLNPLDKALAYRELMDRFSLTQEQVAERIGQKRATVANFLRLLNLPDPVKEALREGRISMGHARAILACEEPERQVELCNRTIAAGLSVREVERLAARPAAAPRERRRKAAPDPQIAEVEDYLRRFFGTRVTVNHRGKRGKIVIEYFSVADLNRILSLLEDKRGM